MPLTEPENLVEFEDFVYAEFWSDSMDEIWDFVYDKERSIFIELASKNLAINYRQRLYSRRLQIHKEIYKNLPLYNPISILHKDNRLFVLWIMSPKNIKTHKQNMAKNFYEEDSSNV